MEVDFYKVLLVLNFDCVCLDSIEFFLFKEVVKVGLGGMMVGYLEVFELGKNLVLIFLYIIYNLFCWELGF